ncbi:MAG: hypothetical protein MZW92_55525 [Comamonadaceae bacterium]|nr:hypothetical protein [Comamonadaceae bacterium]
MKAYTTSFYRPRCRPSAAGRQRQLRGAATTQSNWTGDLVAAEHRHRSITNGEPSTTRGLEPRRTKLATPARRRTGWDTGRRVATWDPSRSSGVALSKRATRQRHPARQAEHRPTAAATTAATT